MKLPISLCMIIKNEERFLRKCLESACEIVAEIIIGDTGSTDRSLDIAKQFGAEIINMDWTNDFATARNIVLARAVQPYILIMDADEELDISTIAEIRGYLDRNSKLPGRVIIRNVLDLNEVSYAQSVRIFPNHIGLKFTGKIHEQLQLPGQSLTSIQTTITINHYGYKQEYIIEEDKINRNLNVLLEMHNENPNDTYILYQIGKTYYVAKEYELAISYLSEVITLFSHGDIKLVSYASSTWLTICYSLYHVKKFQLLNKYIDLGIEFFNDYTDLYFIYGLSLTSMNHPEALELIPSVFNYCLQLGEVDPLKYETSVGVGSYKAHYNLGVYWEIVGDIECARTHYSLSANAGYEMASIRLKLLE